uniref:4-trimethylaminobutyraldehyde dehydrogenase isoform X1 n=1 Tax=Myxine glutinosa TaxID=7769 RepID=UPI00358FBA5F
MLLGQLYRHALPHVAPLRSLRRQLAEGQPWAEASALNFVHGRKNLPLRSSSTELYDLLNPATGETLCRFPMTSREETGHVIKAAADAFSAWALVPASERGQVLRRAAALIRERREELAVLEAKDTGKPIYEARIDMDSGWQCLDFFASMAQTISGQHIPLGAQAFVYTRREPLGVCAGIGAWNFPFQGACWKSAPALACGNTMVFKPSPLAPLTTVSLAEIYLEAGLPPGAFCVVQGAAETGEALCKHPAVAKVSCTGSVNTGVQVLKQVAEGLKPVTLELGGKSPLVIFADCDVENSINGALMANFLSQGQVCSNATRVFVERPLLDTFLERIEKRVRTIVPGNPLREETRMGALISAEHLNRVLQYVEGARVEGARVVCGGERFVPEERSLQQGFYMTPCVLGNYPILCSRRAANCRDEMRVVREEVFGPVMSVLSFDTEDEVIRRANSSSFGLSSGIFTRDLSRAHRVAAALQAGTCYINNFNIFPMEMPVGGYKMSGLGRENGAATMEHYSQLKSVYVELGDVESTL